MNTWSHLRNQRSQQINLVYLQFLLNYALFPKNWCRKLLKKRLECESILHNSTELSVDWTSRELQNQTILFQKRLSLRWNIILKLLSLHNPEVTVFSYMYLAK